jgi:hypothetical protein
MFSGKMRFASAIAMRMHQGAHRACAWTGVPSCCPGGAGGRRTRPTGLPGSIQGATLH